MDYLPFGIKHQSHSYNLIWLPSFLQTYVYNHKTVKLHWCRTLLREKNQKQTAFEISGCCISFTVDVCIIPKCSYVSNIVCVRTLVWGGGVHWGAGCASLYESDFLPDWLLGRSKGSSVILSTNQSHSSAPPQGVTHTSTTRALHQDVDAIWCRQTHWQMHM